MNNYCTGLRTRTEGISICCRDHDQQYGKTGTLTRRQADTALWQCIAAQGRPIRAWFIWAAVRCCGWAFFKRQTSVRAGLRAITAAMPTFAIEPAEPTFADPSVADYWQSVALASEALGTGFDIPTAIHNAAAGKYLLFTVRDNGELVGSCGIYLRGRWAQEDMLFIAPTHREPGLARAFLAFGEQVLRDKLGIAEFRCLVSNPAMQRLLRQAGYREARVQMIKQVTP